MPDAEQTAAAGKRSPIAQVWSTLAGLLMICAFVYFLLGFLNDIYFVKEFPRAIQTLRYGSVALLVGLGGWGAYLQFSEARVAELARQTNEKVVAAFNQVKDRTPGQSVAEIQTEQVSAALQGPEINKQQLNRLVNQRKQELLIDDQYLLKEIESLVMNFLPPLPRNAKRFMNRFRVNLLIAVNRKLLTTEPRLTGQQIGKWLILMERWPQLGRSLSVTPEKMEDLEKKAQEQVITQPDGSQTDPFMELIKVLAPAYVGDGQLREFIQFEPHLTEVAARLAHLGADEIATTAASAASAK